MALRTFEDLYVDELKDLYSAEQQIIKALPKMIKVAYTPELKDAFNQHLTQTREQVKRLDLIFDELGKSPRGKRCVGMQGLVEESKTIMSEKTDPAVKDAGLISAAQRVEHYEMAGYGTVRTFAKLLGYDDAAHVLQQTLDEESKTDRKLSELAKHLINPSAEGKAERDDDSYHEREDMGVQRNEDEEDLIEDSA